MPKLSLDIPHSLGQEEAARRLEKIAVAHAEHQNQVSNLRQQWQDHTFSFGFHVLGMVVTGTVAVEDKRVKFVTHLPLAASLFKGQIEDRVRRELASLLVAQPAG